MKVAVQDRLRQLAGPHSTEHEAADLIERLEAENEELRRALVDGYAELTETHGSPEANFEAAVLAMREAAFKYADSFMTGETQ